MANANNWTDLTDNLTPADSGPGQLDTLLFQTGGGLLTGAVSVNFAQFAGGAPWTLASTGTLLAGTTIEVLPGGVFTNDGGVVDPPALVIDAGGTSGGFGTFDFGTVTNNGRSSPRRPHRIADRRCVTAPGRCGSTAAVT
jgi:hypothetical protein